MLMPEVFAETFEDLKTSIEQENIELLRCDLNYCVWFDDNDTIEMTSNLPRLKKEIQRLEGPESFPRLCSFLAESGAYYDLALKYVLSQNFPSVWSLLRPKIILALLRMRPWATVYGRVSRYFYSDKMCMLRTFAAMYLGMSHYAAPGAYILLQYIETVDGVWYPRGGFQAVSFSPVSMAVWPCFFGP